MKTFSYFEWSLDFRKAITISGNQKISLTSKEELA